MSILTTNIVCVCMCVCVYIYICTCIYVCVYIYTHRFNYLIYWILGWPKISLGLKEQNGKEKIDTVLAKRYVIIKAHWRSRNRETIF